MCGADDLILFTSNPDDYVSQLTCVCSESTLPHVPNCSVKGPAAMSKYGPVKLTVTLKDKDGLLVPNQSEHLRVKRESFTGSVIQVFTHFHNTYNFIREEQWKETILKQVSMIPIICNYSTIEQERCTCTDN